MTEQKAIDGIVAEMCDKDCLGFIKPEICNNCPYKMAINALKRQIPKKVREGDWTYGLSYHCPECSTCVKKIDEYCYFCGQRLDWEGV